MFLLLDLDRKAEHGGEVEEAWERQVGERTEIEGEEEEFEVAEPSEEEGSRTAEMEGVEIQRKEEEDEEDGEEREEPGKSLSDFGSYIVRIANESNGNGPYLEEAGEFAVH